MTKLPRQSSNHLVPRSLEAHTNQRRVIYNREVSFSASVVCRLALLSLEGLYLVEQSSFLPHCVTSSLDDSWPGQGRLLLSGLALIPAGVTKYGAVPARKDGDL